jgi:hypothetical protein
MGDGREIDGKETGREKISNQKAEKVPFRKYQIRSQSNKWADEEWKLKLLFPSSFPPDFLYA